MFLEGVVRRVDLMDIAKQYGLFAALVAYVLWENNKREARYISIIEKLTAAFSDLKRDVEEIKNYLKGSGKQ